MSLGISLATKTARSTALLNAIVGGGGQSKVLLYTDPVPAAGAAITTQTLLATILSANPFGTVAAGVLTASQSAYASVVATGTATWFRILDPADTWVLDGIFPDDFTLESYSLIEGGTVRISGGTIPEP